MFTKKIIGLLALLIPVSVIAQQVPDVQQKPVPLPVPARPISNVSAPANPPAAAEASVKATVISPGALTIQAVAVAQEQEMASAVAKQLGIAAPTKNTEAPIQIQIKPVIPKPLTPYFESVVGPEGREVASFRLNNGVTRSVKVGDSVESWLVKQISNGRVLYESTTATSRINKRHAKVGMAVARAKWISVGEFLK